MKECRHLVIFIFFLSLIIVSWSCGGNDKDKKTGLNKELTESLISADSAVIIAAKSNLDIFYKTLKSSDYSASIKIFKPELLVSPGEDALKTGLENRNKAMGLPEQFKIVYNYLDNKNKADTVYFFVVRVFSATGGMNYEKIGFEKLDNQYVVGLYEYSPAPYYDVISANDSRCELYKAVKTLFDVINTKKYDNALKLVDESIVEQQGAENLKQMLEKQYKSYLKITDFEVKSVNIEILEGIPVISLVVDVEDENKDVFTDKISFNDRLGVLKITKYERIKKEDIPKDGDASLTEKEYGSYKKEAGNFYQNLSNNNFDEIMNKIDKSVFQNNDYNTVKNSFVSRNSYYGIPIDTQKKSHSAKVINGIKIVDFYYEITNSNGIKSYEKISIAYSNGNFLLYAYDYSDKPLK
jgi:hypothetical protein